MAPPSATTTEKATEDVCGDPTHSTHENEAVEHIARKYCPVPKLAIRRHDGTIWTIHRRSAVPSAMACATAPSSQQKSLRSSLETPQSSATAAMSTKRGKSHVPATEEQIAWYMVEEDGLGGEGEWVVETEGMRVSKVHDIRGGLA